MSNSARRTGHFEVRKFGPATVRGAQRASYRPGPVALRLESGALRRQRALDRGPGGRLHFLDSDWLVVPHIYPLP